MALSLNRFSLKAPPPRVVLLPDALFFVRTIPIAPSATAADVAGQVELALESLAPFPLSHMYYAHHWVPGATAAVVYAAYRKRFTTEEAESWSDAAMVLPRFATLLTARVDRASTVILTLPDGLTAIHWGDHADVPSTIVTRSWSEETEPGEKARIRDELLRSLGGTKSVIDIDEAPQIETHSGGTEYVFRARNLAGTFTREQIDALDVRDKEDLAARRRARSRDLLLWRTFVACAAGVVLAGALELGLIGGRFWQRSQQSVIARQAPVVSDIQRAQTLATRIEELSTKRLRPFEMITIVGAKRPSTVVFLRTTTRSLYTMEIEATANSPADVGAFQAALRQMQEIAKVDIERQGTRDGTSNFVMAVTFKPEAFSAPRT
ncbi:hypothetical protein DB347_05255 [Opitutaceae bacterium EW11]|nr:hypothetical protein DB347_05255 [Opitutaceae bacterium EW11]